MVRILQIGMSDNLGGIEIFLINHYRKINKNFFQFDFINMYENDLCFQSEIESLGGKVYRVPNEKKHPFKFRKALEKILKENNYEIVHVHKNSLAFIDVFKILKKYNVKVKIIHSHNTKSSKPNFFINLLHVLNKKVIGKYCDYFYACSKAAGDWMFSDQILNSCKFSVVNNAIDLSKFKYDINVRKKIREELGIEEDCFVIGHVGRFTNQKNHMFLIDIFNEINKKNNNSILLLVGQGPLMNDVISKVNSLNLNGKVKFLGQRNDVNDLYQAFDVFLLPSLYEGLPVVGVEAQASGLLCVLSDAMTKETKVLNSTIFMSLSNDEKEWADEVLNSFKNYNRIDAENEISSNGFNIDVEVKKIEYNYKKYIK